jgi:hypothetical protein
MATSIDRMGYTDSFNYGKQGSGPKTIQNNYGAYSEKMSSAAKPAQKKKIPKPTPKPASYDKSTWDTKTKVSQGTIDQIKSMGMSKALGSVKGAAASSKDDSSAKAFAEGVRRLYGDQRYNAAVGKPAAGKVAPRNAVMASKAETSREPAKKTGNFTYGSGNAPTSIAKKKSGSGFTNTGRAVAGVGAAALTAVALKKLGPVGAAMAAKGAAQGLAKTAGKLVPKEAAASKALSASGRVAAKVKKPVTQSQFEAMKAEAAKKGIKFAPKTSKASVAKKVVKKKVVSNKKLAATTGASTATLSGDSVKKR